MMLRLKKTRPHNHMEKLVDALVKDERSSQSVKALKYARQMITLGWKVAICLHRPGPAGRTRLGVSRHVEDKCPNAHRYALYHESRYLWSVLKPPPTSAYPQPAHHFVVPVIPPPTVVRATASRGLLLLSIHPPRPSKPSILPGVFRRMLRSRNRFG
jgi:hypothetical protein